MSDRLLAPDPPRSPWQLLYGGALAWRRRFWRSHARRLPRPVVSVGNLHWGGSGKTPLVAAIATWARDRGRRPAILSRGYGGRGRGVRLVSAGDGPLREPDEVGDEPVLLARELPGVAVVVAPRRFDAGRRALAELEPPPDLFLLDDGFSHVRLARDLDLLAFPAADPFAGGRLAPGGRLREPLAASRHADAVVLTGTDEEASEERAGRRLAEALGPFGFRGPGFSAAILAGAARLESGDELAQSARVVAVSGLARNVAFHDLARRVGFEIVAALELSDHHAYPETTLGEITGLWERHAADAVLTTAKDHVKLAGRLDLPLAVLPVSARPEPGFWSWLESALDALPPPERLEGR